MDYKYQVKEAFVGENYIYIVNVIRLQDRVNVFDAVVVVGNPGDDGLLELATERIEEVIGNSLEIIESFPSDVMATIKDALREMNLHPTNDCKIWR